MKAIITVNMDNAAFTENKGSELARILSLLAGYVSNYEDLAVSEGCKLRDINGNIVGSYRVTEEDD